MIQIYQRGGRDIFAYLILNGGEPGQRIDLNHQLGFPLFLPPTFALDWLDPPDSRAGCFCFLISLSGLASIQRLGRIVMRKDGIPGCAGGGGGK